MSEPVLGISQDRHRYDRRRYGNDTSAAVCGGRG